MSVWRIAIVGLVASLAWSGETAAQDVRDEIGPIERRAKPTTPENPIPRRTYSIAPQYPAEAQAIDATATVTLQLTLDESGRIAEIRKVNNPFVLAPPPNGTNPASLRAAADALVRAAAAALRQWQYDAPAQGPISFAVIFGFRPGTEPTTAQSSIPLGGRAAGPPAPPVPGAPLRVGGNVRAPVRVKYVPPVYGDAAKAAGLQGVVILEATIGPDGKVTDARVLRSVPGLDAAAIDSVKQWEYEPTLLNGAPVPIVVTVTVQFTMS